MLLELSFTAATLVAISEATFSVFPPSSSDVPTECDHILFYDLTNCTFTTSNESYWCGETCLANLFKLWPNNGDLCQSLKSRPDTLITGFFANIDEILELCPDKVLELSFDMIPEGQAKPVPSNIQITFESITPTTDFITPATETSTSTTAISTADTIMTETGVIVSSNIEDIGFSARYLLLKTTNNISLITILITLLG